VVVHTNTVIDAGNGLKVLISRNEDGALDGAAYEPAYSIILNGDTWLTSAASGSGAVSYLGSTPILAAIRRSSPPFADDVTLKTPHSHNTTTAAAATTTVTLTWADSEDPSKILPWETSFVTNPTVPGAVVFRQTFTQSIKNVSKSWLGKKEFGCDTVREGQDQTGGKLLNDLSGQTATQCCSACHKNASCNAWVMEGPDHDGYFYKHCKIYSHVTGSKVVPNKRMGGHPGPRKPAAGDPNSVLAGFPAFQNGENERTAASPVLNAISWGGCQLSPSGGTPGTSISRWTNVTTDASATQGIPLLLYAQSGKSLIISPADHFFIALHSTMSSGLIAAGIKASVVPIPAGTTYDTIMYTSDSNSTNDTLVGWGDILLRKSGKARVDPYSDFILSHLGYWTDAGAFHYQDPSPYLNYETAMLAVKKDAAAREIPFRYFQFDDWWAVQRGDFGGDEGPLHLKAGPGGGLLYWQPRSHVFPSGLTDWLGLPLSLYAPAYSIDSSYINESLYTWAKDPISGHALPTDRSFYDSLFKNGTRAGMKMFEQDFMCAINTDTNLTNTDLNIGKDWLAAMDAAAGDANITLQFCMMNGVHALATTTVEHVTNGRATRDNHPHLPQSTSLDPGNAGNGQVLGISGMLHYALGIWPSRDNVWTNSTVQEHGGPEPMPKTQTLLAVLAGGPYGPSDAAGAGNKSLIMRSCRSDGVLLRADKPITMLDAALTTDAAFNREDPTSLAAVNVWGTHSDLPDGLRWSYVLGLNLLKPFSVFPSDILPASGAAGAAGATGVVGAADTAKTSTEFVAWEYWGGPETSTRVRVNSSSPLVLPATGEPANIATIASSYYVLAPVLANGWSFLGEPTKIVAASSRRVSWVQEIIGGGLEALLRGAAKENAIFAVAAPSLRMASTLSIMYANCTFGGDGARRKVDQAGTNANDQMLKIQCTPVGMKCTCIPSKLVRANVPA
jgi:hypothetical protein